jgi:hypothetical protein
MQWLLVTEDFYILTMLVLKVSLAIFFLRILIDKWQRRIIIATVTVSTLFGIAYFFFAVFQCGVVKNSFDLWFKFASHKCITRSQILGISYTHATITTGSDWIFALIPLSMMKQLQLRWKEKLIVGFILTLGAM